MRRKQLKLQKNRSKTESKTSKKEELPPLSHIDEGKRSKEKAKDRVSTAKPEGKKDQSRRTSGKYATLMENNFAKGESWYYFIKFDGNEDNLHHLQKQLKTVEWYESDDLAIFTLDLENLVSPQTAKEMTKVDVNEERFNGKYDGTLSRIDFGLKSKYGPHKMMYKIHRKIGDGRISDFAADEDIDSDDLITEEDDYSSSEED